MSDNQSTKQPVLWLAIGCLILVAALLLPEQSLQTIYWTEADAKQFSKASADYHNAAYGPQHKHEAGKPDDHQHAGNQHQRDAAKQAFELAKSKLDAAQSKPKFWKYLFQIVGASLAAVGLFIYWRANRATQPEKASASHRQPSK